MQIKTNITEEREVDIEIPFFRKDQNSSCISLLAVLNEATVTTIFQAALRTNVTVDHPKNYSSDIVNAYSKWEPITELEFLAAHTTALKSMSLIPELVKDDLKEVSVFDNVPENIKEHWQDKDDFDYGLLNITD
jgi:hypothetical protein